MANPSSAPTRVIDSKAQVVPLSVGQITKETWAIATSMPSLTWAVFLIQIPITIFVSLIPDEEDMNVALHGNIQGLYELLISGFLFFAVYRAVYRYSISGQSTGLGQLYADGLPFWWRNFKISFLSGLYAFALILLAMLPSGLLMLLNEALDGEHEAVFIILAVLAGIAGLVFALRKILGITLCVARLAEGRQSASEAINYSSKITKGHLGTVMGVVGMAMLYVVFCMLIAFSTYAVLSVFTDDQIGLRMEIVADLCISIPFAFVEVLTSTSLALLYLRLSKT